MPNWARFADLKRGRERPLLFQPKAKGRLGDLFAFWLLTFEGSRSDPA